MRSSLWFWLCALPLLWSCGGGDPELRSLQLSLIPLEGRKPVQAESGPVLPPGWQVSRTSLEAYGFRYMGHLVYAMGMGDTVDVSILEFEEDLAALGFLLNAGYTREGLPVVRGDQQERSVRAGRRLFLFSSSAYRPLPAEAADRFVQAFPGYRAGLPPEFLALPLKGRVSGGTSLALHGFLGEAISFPMLVQRYGDASGYWQCARSWGSVSASDWNSLLHGIGKRMVTRHTNIGIVACEAAQCTWMDRLADGRLIFTYGDVDTGRLTNYYLAARQAMTDVDR